MQRLLAGIIAIVLVFSACESTPDNDDGQIDTTQTSANDTASPGDGPSPTPPDDASRDAAGPGASLQTILAQAFQRDSQGRLTLLDRLNEPRSVSVETRQNGRDPGQTDTLGTRQYDGLQLIVYHVSGGKEILKTVAVTGDQYETDRGLSVGTTRSEVENLRGRPDQRQDGEYVYNLGGPMPTMLHVSFSGDEVSRLEWQYPID